MVMMIVWGVGVVRCNCNILTSDLHAAGVLVDHTKQLQQQQVLLDVLMAEDLRCETAEELLSICNNNPIALVGVVFQKLSP